MQLHQYSRSAHSAKLLSHVFGSLLSCPWHKNHHKLPVWATWAIMSPRAFFWCLRPSGRNMGTLQSQGTICAVPKCRVIITKILQNCLNFYSNNAICMLFEIYNLQKICRLGFSRIQSTNSNICWYILLLGFIGPANICALPLNQFCHFDVRQNLKKVQAFPKYSI